MKQARSWIVLIGSTPEIALAVGEALQGARFTFSWFPDTGSFQATSLEQHPRCVLVDFDCEQLQHSFSMLEDLLKATWRWPSVVINFRGELPLPVQMLRLYNFIFLDEPYSHKVLLRAIRYTRRFKPYRTANDVSTALHLIRELSRLTPREMVIAGEMLHGYSTKEIARSFDLSSKTVEIHRSRVLQKLRSQSTTKLLWRYLEEATG
ncbi:two-component system response regulator FixJ [Methylohalomonas lacus]|uniref:Two-component system response regulator FixJ n=1 Tax=Methylohalomonas lacus TaxID=398773 RepID=A0AAE3L1I1_9GAMM|nr:LuxR C-terminal-related transcriptional regulator [Methylohalomonas lacus]MCS3904089.1 two-component system response regulator FixJ [Methylohalomonas lacus]